MHLSAGLFLSDCCFLVWFIIFSRFSYIDYTDGFPVLLTIMPPSCLLNYIIKNVSCVRLALTCHFWSIDLVKPAIGVWVLFILQCLRFWITSVYSLFVLPCLVNSCLALNVVTYGSETCLPAIRLCVLSVLLYLYWFTIQVNLLLNRVLSTSLMYTKNASGVLIIISLEFFISN